MTTIGDLEQKAGIGSSPEERTAFWLQFRHLKGEACLRAGVAELNRLIAEKEIGSAAAAEKAGARSRRWRSLSADEEQAVIAYAAKHGRRWKSVLNNAWMGNPPHDDGGLLRQIRNSHGPSGLVTYRLPKRADTADMGDSPDDGPQ